MGGYAFWSNISMRHFSETDGNYTDGNFEALLIYLDDILIWGKTVSQTLERLGNFLERLRSANLKLKPSKCALFQKSVTFLGHIVSSDGISCDPAKIESVKSWPIPTSRKEVKSFLLILQKTYL